MLPPIIDANTLALWLCHEASASDYFVDETGNEAALILDGAPPPYTDRLVINARSVSAANVGYGSISAAALTALTDVGGNSHDMTIEVWVRRGFQNNAGTYNNIFYASDDLDHGRLFTLAVHTANNTILWTQTTTSGTFTWEPGVTISANSVRIWDHIAVTRTANAGKYDLRMYKNGVLGASSIGSCNWGAATDQGVGRQAQWGMGRYPVTSGFRFIGEIGEVRISKVARTAAEILETYTRATTNNNGESTTVAGDTTTVISGPRPTAMKKVIVRGPENDRKVIEIPQDAYDLVGIMADYSQSAALTLTSAVAKRMQWDTAVVASNFITTGTGWKFTAPSTSLYEVKAMASFTVNSGIKYRATLVMFKNGVAGREAFESVGDLGAASSKSVQFGTTIPLEEGDELYFELTVTSSDASNVLTLANANANFINISRVWNTWQQTLGLPNTELPPAVQGEFTRG